MPDGLSKVGWESSPHNQTARHSFQGGFALVMTKGKQECVIYEKVTMWSFLELYVLVTIKGEWEYVVSL